MAYEKRKSYTRVVSDLVITDIAHALPRVVARTATSIQTNVPVYSGPATGERRRRIEALVIAAYRGLCDQLIGRARPDPLIYEMFYQVGLNEGRNGLNIDAVRAAMHLAVMEAWVELQRVVVSHGLSRSTVVHVVDLLFEQAGSLWGQIEQGHRLGSTERASDFKLAREQLGVALLGGAPPGQIAQLSLTARWTIPATGLIVLIPFAEEEPLLDVTELPHNLLVIDGDGHQLVIGDANHRDSWLSDIAKASAGVPVLVSLPSPIGYWSDAIRHVERLEHLIEQGVVEPQAIVDSADHEMALWLFSEPLLRDRMRVRILAAFSGKSPLRRRQLGETLLDWLEHRSSAGVMAERLGLHPQTVRVRMRQIEAILGDELKDSEISFAMLLVLKSMTIE